MSSEAKSQSRPLQIELKCPYCILEGLERNSKLLLEDSELYKVLECIRTKLKENYAGVDCRPLHTDLSLGAKNKAAAVDKRANLIHVMTVDVADKANWGFINSRAFVLNLPEVDGIKPHITVGYFMHTKITEAKQKELIELALSSV